MEAYSTTTDTTYPDWASLVEAESYGYIVVAMFSKGRQTWARAYTKAKPDAATDLYGPGMTKVEARRHASKVRRRINKDLAAQRAVVCLGVHVEPLWKGEF